MGVICFEWYVSAWLWVLFFFLGALLGFGYEYLEPHTDNYPRSFGAFSFQTPWSLCEDAATLSWISATNNQQISISSSAPQSTTPPPLHPHPAPVSPCHLFVCRDVHVWWVFDSSLLMCKVITARLHKQLNPASYVLWSTALCSF